ncbi:hypothetical protein [Aurantimonas sp. HBX-1]|uniref:hypothetical protein n=1 Tax=Aurantimonas sp. HBX-1 TaxID=2906072 RepID=UPI001F169BE3|nr:hypothetical protein [Aurantimonas sp. HBX-1]UIJ73383.1 hypothetical protein LXB15_07035 [Aurantimonas sp. HBX-1]
MAKENKPIDWACVEQDYRAGVMSVRDIARWYGVSHTAINKKAKTAGWGSFRPAAPFEPQRADHSFLSMQRTRPTRALEAPQSAPAVSEPASSTSGR